MRSTQIFALISALILIVGTECYSRASDSSQTVDLNEYQIGLYAGLNSNSHNVDFRALPGVPSCCPAYRSGSGLTPTLGLLHHIPLSGEFGLQLRTGYDVRSVLFESDEPTTVVNTFGEVIDGTIHHSLDVRLHYLNLDFLGSYRLFGALSLTAGGGLAIPLGQDYEQDELLREPATGTFENGSRRRNAFKGDVEDAAHIQTLLRIGLTYELPLTASGNWRLVPELLFSRGLASPVSELEWSVQALSAGLSLRFLPFERPAPERVDYPEYEELPPPESESDSTVIAQIDGPLPLPTLEASIEAVGLDSLGKEYPEVIYEVEEFVSLFFQPLLPYIFFDANSAVIPERYAQLEPEAVDSVSLSALATNGSILQTYYHILNVVGKRMQLHPAANLTLTGCNAGEGAEKANIDLSRARAEKVKQYLTDVWQVAPGRIRVEARNVPRAASLETTPSSIQENRRVELSSDEAAILEPVIAHNIVRTVSPPRIRLFPRVEAIAGIDHWEATLSQGSSLLKRWRGRGTPPQRIDWEFPDNLAISSENFAVVLNVRDSADQNLTTDPARLGLETLTMVRKKRERRQDMEIERFIVLFPIRSAELDQVNRRIVSFISSRIEANSGLRIIGYTDMLGDEKYNDRLASERAASVAVELGIPEARIEGFGETATLYDLSLPEGRCYTRTVEVIIESRLAQEN